MPVSPEQMAALASWSVRKVVLPILVACQADRPGVGNHFLMGLMALSAVLVFGFLMQRGQLGERVAARARRGVRRAARTVRAVAARAAPTAARRLRLVPA